VSYTTKKQNVVEYQSIYTDLHRINFKKTQSRQLVNKTQFYLRRRVDEVDDK